MNFILIFLLLVSLSATYSLQLNCYNRILSATLSSSTSSSSKLFNDNNINSLIMKNRKVTETRLNNNNEIIQGVGVEGCKLTSPSGINSLSTPIQFVTVSLISAALYAGTMSIISIINILESYLPDIMRSWESSWFILGAFFMLAGVAHFTVKKDFENIYPSQGAWGVWYLPGSAEFHVAWTGVAEILGGLWLLIGGLSNLGLFTLPSYLGPVMQDGAKSLLYLTILVTPANIYMLTHGAKLPIDGPEVPINFHVIRLSIQCLLFAMFYKISLM